MKQIIIIAALFMLTACERKKPLETFHHGEFKVELLFEIDGCKVYRFRDERTVYFSDCRGKMEHTEVIHHGKGGNVTKHYTTLNN